MKKNNKRKGIWIPVELIENKDLDWSNKVLLSEIYSLHEQEKGCIASDRHFADLLGLKNESNAQKRVEKLVKWELLDKKVITNNRKIIGKILTPKHPLSSIGKVKINKSKGKKVGNENQLEVTSQKNDSRDQTGQTNSSQETKDVIPMEIESSSSESDLVVLGSQVSSSPENIINTKKNSINNNTIINTSGPIQEIGIDLIPEDLIFLLKKYNTTGWGSLTAPEARRYWDYKENYSEEQFLELKSRYK